MIARDLSIFAGWFVSEEDVQMSLIIEIFLKDSLLSHCSLLAEFSFYSFFF